MIPDDTPAPGGIAILGLPFDAFSSYMRGAAGAPTRIRAAYHSPAANLCAENGVDLGASEKLHDLGDLELGSGMAALAQIEEAISMLRARDLRVIALGGDHSVTYPILRGYARHGEAVNILHLDAHPDLYHTFGDNRYSHACPFARIMEERLARRLVQVGIRTMNPHQRAQAARFGVEVIEARDWTPDVLPVFQGPVYLSLDLDVLDPAYAPGVSHYEPGGLTTRDVLRLISKLAGSLVGADIVEYNPDRDPLGITAAVAAKFLKEIAAVMEIAHG